MKIKKRFIASIVETAKTTDMRPPFARGSNRTEMIARRNANRTQALPRHA